MRSARGRRAGSNVDRADHVKRLFVPLGVFVAVALIMVFAGPVASGAILLLFHPDRPRIAHDLPASYTPLHKGHVDLATGLYIREDEDIVVRGTPALILRRTYLSNYRQPKEFGIGTTHNGEWYLVGDGERFSWAALIFADGSRVRFDRTSVGSSYMNALYENSEATGVWTGALLGWTGLSWTVRRHDGSTDRFRPCGVGSECSLMQSRDADGHTIDYQRNPQGRLVKMQASADRWIAFEYDTADRIVRAYSSQHDEVRYDYDARGRLTQATSHDGATRRYGYTSEDQMASIDDPAIGITNTFDGNGRCVHQLNRFPGKEETLSFRFDYVVQAGRVVETTSTQSDGTWSRYQFDERRQATSEAWGSEGVTPTTIAYARDSAIGTDTVLTVTCPDRRGLPLTHKSLARPGTMDWVKQDLLETYCH